MTKEELNPLVIPAERVVVVFAPRLRQVSNFMGSLKLNLTPPIRLRSALMPTPPVCHGGRSRCAIGSSTMSFLLRTVPARVNSLVIAASRFATNLRLAFKSPSLPPHGHASQTEPQSSENNSQTQQTGLGGHPKSTSTVASM